MDWRIITLGLSVILALSGVAIFLVIAGKKWAKFEEEEQKRHRMEAEAAAIAEAMTAQREREANHVQRVEDILRHADDLGPVEFERLFNTYPSENRATAAARARGDAH